MNIVRVVIVGGGFAGINAAKVLTREIRALHRQKLQLKIQIIDRRNHHLFQPLLYQVATAGLSPADIATPIRSLFKDSEVEVILDEVKRVDLTRRLVEGESNPYHYDYLVLACGANHSYFSHPEWEESAPGLKTLEQATEIRRRILTAFEEAEKAESEVQVREWSNFVIVGGGPTGVEMAGAIAELSKHTVRDEYRNFDPAKSRVILVEATDRVLAAFSPESSERARRDLVSLGVEIKLATRVENITDRFVVLNSAIGKEELLSRTVIWAAGVAPSILGKNLFLDPASSASVELDSSGRVKVLADLRLPASDRVFVLGDQAHFLDSQLNRPLPGLAPVAMQQGRHAARNLLRLIRGQPTQPFQYLDKGIMATIGRKRAVMESAGIRLGGFLAWLGWLVIHIYYLIGFKNRLFVILQWVWSYLTFSRGARLIVAKDWKLKP